jgi:DNA-binding SARP family transcriptional activator/tetratricopeptide (TPR) repeat protein
VGVEFRSLGPVEVWRDGHALDLGHRRQRSVLAVLLVDVNTAVPVDQIVDRVWGENPPHTARGTLYGYLHRLRRVLADLPDVDITREAGGYLLAADPLAVDLHRFRHLVRTARDSGQDDALALLDEALGLWHGEPFAGMTTSWFETVRRGLHRDRLAAELDRIDLALRRGRHREQIAVLATLTEAHPLDERIAGQLMLALYRDNRQSEALNHYHRVRRRLVDELGTEPAPALRELFQQILTGAAPRDSAPPAGGPAPRQLPAPPSPFVARRDDLTRLGELLAAANVAVISGPGGIGKTWFALAWAHRNADRFPDGQLFVNLRGFDPAGEPLAPGVALHGLLESLGIRPDEVPADPDRQAALYRSLLAERSMLVLLDGARDTEQVLPLLPGSPACVVLVTSRHRLEGLTASGGARAMTLGPLSDVDAGEVLAAHLGRERLDTAPDAVHLLLQMCAGLPLAVGILAARAAAYPDFPLTVFADELRDTGSRLDSLDTGDLTANLRTVFATSCAAVSPPAARLLAMLATAPVPDIGCPAAAALADEPEHRVRRLLRELDRAHLLHQHVPGRYRMHDLVRLYAAEQAGETAHRTALRRLIDHTLHIAHRNDQLANPHHEPMEPAPPPSTVVVTPAAGRAEAMAWFDVEHAGVLELQRAAAEHGWDDAVWQLAWVLDGYLWRRGHLTRHVQAWRAGLAAARGTGQVEVRARAHRRLGHAYARAGQYDEAADHLQEALVSAKEAGHSYEEARTHDVFAWLWARRGDYEQALLHATRMLEIYQTTDRPDRTANALNTVGWYHSHLGEQTRARNYCEQALAVHRERGDRDGEGCVLDSLGHIAVQEGRFADALDRYGAALRVFREIGNSYEEANTLVNLGDVHRAAGRHDDARRAWREALDLYRGQGRTDDSAHVLVKLEDPGNPH